MMEAQEAETLLSLVGLGRGRGGGGGHRGRGGGFHRRGRGGRGWGGRGGNWVWGDWGSDVIVYNCPPGYYYDLYGNCVPCPPGHYVDDYGRCLPLPGFSGPPASHGGSLPPLTPILANPMPQPPPPPKPPQQPKPPKYSTSPLPSVSRRPAPSPQAPLKPVETSAATSSKPTSFPSDAPTGPRRGPRIPHGIGMDYTAAPTPGDYHVNGNAVVLRALPSYESKEIASLQNGEGIHLFGEVQSDPKYVIENDDTVVLNDGSWAGIDYAHVGTETHGAGWIAMPYIEPGAGAQVKKPQPAPQPTPSSPTTATNYVPWLLGGSLIVLGGGAIYLLASRTAATYRTRTA